MARKSVKRTKKRSGTSRKSGGAKAKSSAKLPDAPWVEVRKHIPEGDVSVVELEWQSPYYALVRSLGGVNVKGVGHVVPTEALTDDLRAYTAKPYSWGRYVADRANNAPVTPRPTRNTGEFTLRDDQVEDRDTITEAFKAGCPEFLLASSTGVGKTAVAVAAINAMPGKEVLVMCPKWVVPAWRDTLSKMGDGGKRWVLINYESNKNLLRPSRQAMEAKSASTRNKRIANSGTPWFSPDIVVCDEAHKVGNPTAQQTKVKERYLAQGAKSLVMTATPGDDPSKIHYLRRGLAYGTGTTVFKVSEDNFSDYLNWAKDQGIDGLVPAQYGNGISYEGGEEGIKKMRDIIYHSPYTWALRRKPEGWPEQERSTFGIELTEQEKQDYNKSWDEFKATLLPAVSEVRSAKSKKEARSARTTALVAIMRYRQKVGALKVPYVMEVAKDSVKEGKQVVITAIHADTVNSYAEKLTAAKIPYATLTGATEDKEGERLRFQRGEAKVAIISVSEGINLQANDPMLGDEASSAPRVMIVGEPQWSSVNSVQQLGRAHRNGEDSPAMFPVAIGTIDERVVGKLLHRMANMGMLNGDKTEQEDAMIMEFAGFVSGEGN